MLETGVVKVVEMDRVGRKAARYLCVMSLGEILIVNGATSEEHMKDDIEGLKRWESWM